MTIVTIKGGSSPRSWGTAGSGKTSGVVERGSSPRSWGTGPSRRLPLVHRAVHPHARGEQTAAQDAAAASLRFIPTLVGNSITSHGCIEPITVHPHARGEQGQSL